MVAVGDMQAHRASLERQHAAFPAKLPSNVRFPDSSRSYYRPLSRAKKEIRLLTLEPGNLTAPVVCTIQHYVLDTENLPAYNTISYCWGESKMRGWICLDGNIVSVPETSANALRSVRSLQRRLKIWIDAVCIDQEDDEEKSFQVASMKDIYRFANRNAIYLGNDGDGKADSVLKTLKSLLNTLRVEYEKLSDDEKHSYGNERVLPRAWKEKPILSEDMLEGLRPLFELPWFRRLWVFQEAVFARENSCVWGSTWFILDAVLLIARCAIDFHSKHLPISFAGERGALYGLIASSCIYIQRAHTDTRKRLRFGSLRSQSICMVTTDPRDRVFAILGLWQAHNGFAPFPSLLTPDYRKSVRDVFRDATRFQLQEPAVSHSDLEVGEDGSRTLERIYHESEADMTAGGMPSWTIKYDRADLSSVKTPYNYIYPHWRRLGTLQIQDFTDPDILTLRGRLLGNIVFSEPTHPQGWNGQSYFDSDECKAVDAFVQSVEVVRRIVLDYSSHSLIDLDDGYSAVAELVVIERDEAWRTSRGITKVEALKAVLHSVESAGKLPLGPYLLSSDATECEKRDSEFFCVIARALYDRCVFATDDGHVGLGPKILRNGDVLGVFGSGLKPYTLRPIGDEFQFVGACPDVLGLKDPESRDPGPAGMWINLR